MGRIEWHPSPFMASELIVFLDRDGVINRKLPGDRFVCNWSEFEFLPGVPEAIGTLNRHGIRAVLVTNQRGISLDLYSDVDLQRLHASMTSALRTAGARLDAIYYCPHSKSGCECRKPEIGLFRQAFRDFPGATASTSILVGDSMSDMLAAGNLGCRKVLIADVNAAVHRQLQEAGITVEYCCASLLVAVRNYIVDALTGKHRSLIGE